MPDVAEANFIEARLRDKLMTQEFIERLNEE
jgi:hypothetical protein